MGRESGETGGCMKPPARRSNSKEDSFTAMFNPETYSLSYQNRFSNLQGLNTSSRPARYMRSQPQELEVELVLDGTGVTGHEFEIE